MHAVKEGGVEPRVSLHLDDDLTRQLIACKEQPNPSDSVKSKDKKIQALMIRNALRNLVRKKNSPTRKPKNSKSRGPAGEASSKKPPLTATGGKPVPKSVGNSKSRKLMKLFTRKNLSVSLENRKIKEEPPLKKFHEIQDKFTATLR